MTSESIISSVLQSMAGQPIDTNCMTLTRHVLAEQRKYPTAVGNLSQLLTSIQSAVKAISAAVRRAGISNLFGAAGDVNVQVCKQYWAYFVLGWLTIWEHLVLLAAVSCYTVAMQKLHWSVPKPYLWKWKVPIQIKTQIHYFFLFVHSPALNPCYYPLWCMTFRIGSICIFKML